MRTLHVDETGDICFCDGGNLTLIDGMESIKQRCENYAKAAKGEMVTKMQQGIPFFQTAFGARPDIGLFEAFFRKRMLEVEGVISVREFSGKIQDNVLSYYALIETENGQVTING